jgi:hypothetical protein
MSTDCNSGPTPGTKEKMMAYLGKRVVYRETGILAPAIIKEMTWKGPSPYFEVKMEAIEGILLSCHDFGDWQIPLEASCLWDPHIVKPYLWSFATTGCVWRIFLNETACDAVVKLCREKSGLDKKDLFYQVKNLLGEYGIM